MRIPASLLILSTAAACVPRTAPPPPVVPPARTAPSAPVPAPAVGDWRDLPPTSGTWTYRRDARGTLALFGIAGTDAALTLRCDSAARQVYLSRAGSVAAPLTIRTTSLTRALVVLPTGGVPAYVAAALAPGDPLLDAMAFSRGRFVVAQAGAPTLAIPAWAEIGRVAEDCRG